MAKTKLSVKSDLGTFTRTTDRPYAFIVATRETAAWLEEQRAQRVAYATDSVKYHTELLATAERREEHGHVWLFQAGKAYSSSTVEGAERDLRRAQDVVDNRQQPIVDDAQAWGAFQWSSRLDLARKTANGINRAHYYVAVVDVATGQIVSRSDRG